jgi:hypothetical protein
MFPKDDSSELHLTGVGLPFQHGLSPSEDQAQFGFNLRVMMLANTRKSMKIVRLPTYIEICYVHYPDIYLERPSEKIPVLPTTDLARFSPSGRDPRPQRVRVGKPRRGSSLTQIKRLGGFGMVR